MVYKVIFKVIVKEMFKVVFKVILKEVISEFNNDEIISESKLFLKTHIEKSENAAMKIEDKDIRNILLDLNRYLIERSN